MYVLVILRDLDDEVVQTICKGSELTDLLCNLDEEYEFIQAEQLENFRPEFLTLTAKKPQLNTGNNN